MSGPAVVPVSVIITCCNEALSLSTTLDSVVTQGVRSEIVVVDNGSADGADAVARRYPGVRYLWRKKGSLGAARNAGLGASTRPLVVFLEAGDCLLPGALAAGIRALASRGECVMTYGRGVPIAEDGSYRDWPDQPVVRSGHHAAFLRSNLIGIVAAAMFRRSALEHGGGFATGLDGAADYDLYLRITREAPVYDHGTAVVAHRPHSPPVGNEAARMLREMLAVMRRHRADATGPLRPVWTEGWRNWQDVYGTQLVEEIRAALHARHPWPVLWKAAVLARHAPWVLRREMMKKASLSLSRVRPAH